MTVLRKRVVPCLLVLAVCMALIAPCAYATSGGYDPDGWTGEHTHNYSGEQVRVEPTCTSDGYVGTRCTGCEAIRRDQVLPARGHSYVNGRCNVCGARQPNYYPGDLTGDRRVTNEDVVLLLWCVLFPALFPLDGDVDFDGDGKLTNSDVVALMWYSLFPDEYPL